MNLYKLGIPNSEQFFIKEIGNKILIHRKEAGVKWDEHNKYFRSSLWCKETGKLLSAGFRAFVNYGEQPEFEPLNPEDGVRAIQKIDGSLLCVSKASGKLIIRTRGTVDATKLENGYEIAHLILKYPKAFDNEWLDSELYTLLFEWTTPTNRIVLQESTEPTLWLIGMVIHGTYNYVCQFNLDTYAKEMEVNRRKSYGIMWNGSIEDIKKRIEPLQDIEGVVIYDDKAGSDSGQILKKIKTLRYLQLHRVFTGVKTVDHLFDLFVEYGEPRRENFEALLATNFDWELVKSLEHLMDELYLKCKRIATSINWILLYFNNPEFIALDRKGKAQKILELFPNYSGIAFAMLYGKELPPHKLWNTFNG
jgi:hypothetical protein